MIASVSGRVAAVSPDGAVVEVGGIGLAVQCTPGTIARLQVGENARLSTSLIVREGSRHYNRLLFVMPDGQVRHYDKRHLFRMASEQAHYKAGAHRLIVVDVGSPLHKEDQLTNPIVIMDQMISARRMSPRSSMQRRA